jgi:hypothetical protein
MEKLAALWRISLNEYFPREQTATAEKKNSTAIGPETTQNSFCESVTWFALLRLKYWSRVSGSEGWRGEGKGDRRRRRRTVGGTASSQY